MTETVTITTADDGLATQGLRGAGQQWTLNPNFGIFTTSALAIGTVVLVGEGFIGTNFVLYLAIKGASAAPGETAFTTFSYIGHHGLRTLNASDATFVANATNTPQGSNDTFPANTSLWSWNLDGSHDLLLATQYVFTVAGEGSAVGAGGYGDIPNPKAWQDSNNNIPPQQLNNIPSNLNFQAIGDGRYWWQGNATNAPLGAITFIGDTRYLSGIAQLEWQLTQVANDGSVPVLSYALDGVTFVNTTLGPFVQNKGLISGSIQIPLAVINTFKVKVTSSGGTPAANKLNWEVAVAITRNADSLPIWDVSGGPGSADDSALNPFNYNSQVPFLPAYDTLQTLQARLMIRLGFSNQLAAFPPGMANMTHEFLQSAQNYLYRRYTALHTRRWFRWQLIPLQRFYSLLDNDENQIQGHTLDTDKTIEQVMVQDVRNVWYPLVEGIPGQLYTMLAKPWRPARYDIRDAIEIYPAPDQTYFLWVKGHFGLLSLVNPSDQTTIDSELVFLHALATAKAHYGHPDAEKVMAEANTLRATLVGATHKTAKYIPGTIAVPPAVRPTLINFSGQSGGS